MPATRSRTSTEQAAEVASEEVKQQPQEDAEPVVAAPADQEAEAEAAPIAVPEADVVPPVVEESKEVEEPVVASETNGTSEAVPVEETNGTSAEAEPVVEEIESVKRKSDIVAGGEGDGPDSTEVVAKKAKIDDEAEAVAELPAEATA